MVLLFGLVKDVPSSILEELKIWIAHECFTRRPRKGAWNILDVRWVGKWKWAKNKEGGKTRTIRMRMMLRGFKDTAAEGLDTYAGTSSRLSQRIVASEAGCRGWKMTIDVKTVFLKGTTEPRTKNWPRQHQNQLAR